MLGVGIETKRKTDDKTEWIFNTSCPMKVQFSKVGNYKDSETWVFLGLGYDSRGDERDGEWQVFPNKVSNKVQFKADDKNNLIPDDTFFDIVSDGDKVKLIYPKKVQG